MEILITVAFFAFAYLIHMAYQSAKNLIDNIIRKHQNKTYVRYERYRAMLDEEYNKRHAELKNDFVSHYAKFEEEKRVFSKLVEEQAAAAPWLAEMIADFLFVFDENSAEYLKTKYPPARVAADKVREIANEKKRIETECRLMRYQLGVYENLFPWLDDYKEVTSEDINLIFHIREDWNTEYDSLKRWLSPSEYNSLSTTKKYQLALDRYRSSLYKSKWAVGIEYERYIGYLYESHGFHVQYTGAVFGLEDRGRDLIAQNDEKVYIIQCKRWASEKTIHEKHIFQLYGSVTAYKLHNKKKIKGKKVKGLFVTTANLSDFALLCANTLQVEVSQNFPFKKDYPCIKCNISKATKERIYHLPFDQQYDRVVIDPNSGECYVSTVEEAETLGFRRAWKHYSTD